MLKPAKYGAKSQADAQADAKSRRQQLALLLALSRPGALQPEGVAQALARQLTSSGLLNERSGHFTVAPAGLSWLRRQLASSDPFLEQHRQTRRKLTGPAAQAQVVAVNDAESPLSWLRSRKDHLGAPMLDDNQFEAGERLRRDYTFAGMTPRVTANWSPTGGGGGQARGAATAAAMRDDVVAAKARVSRAVEAVGPELAGMLIDVCCLLKGIEVAENGQRLPRRAGRVVLQLGLTALARHYGLISAPGKQRQDGEVLHWGAAGFRPSI